MVLLYIVILYIKKKNKTKTSKMIYSILSFPFRNIFNSFIFICYGIFYIIFI